MADTPTPATVPVAAPTPATPPAAAPVAPLAAPPVASSPPTKASVPPTGDPATDAVNNLETAVAVAPALSKAPGAALDAATAGGDVVTSAQALQGQGARHVNAQAAAVVTQAQRTHIPVASSESLKMSAAVSVMMSNRR